MSREELTPLKSEFDLVRFWIDTFVKDRGDQPFAPDIKRYEWTIKDYLDCISKAEWSEGPVVFDVQVGGYGDSSLPPLVSDINKILKAACQVISPGRLMAVGTAGGMRRHRLYWKIDKSPPSKRPGFKRILVVGNLRTGEWNHDIMRGVRSMARELDIELIDRMQRNWLRSPDSNGDQIPITTIAREVGIDPMLDSILVRNRDHNELAGNVSNLRKEGYHVVTTGYTTGAIKQNLSMVGILLADQCIQDQRELQPGVDIVGEGYQIIVHKHPESEINTTAINEMQQAFCARLEDRTKSKFKVTEFKQTPYYGLHYDRMLKLYSTFLKDSKKSGEGRIAGIFVPDESYGLAALHAFSGEPDGLYRVYCERLARSLLETSLMGKEHLYPACGKKLYAACGLEPYFFGRYALRAATQKKDSFEPAEPVLITADDIRRWDITSPDRIPPFFRNFDVQYNEEKYAWYDWMKGYCKSSYGPNLFKNKEPWAE